MVDALIVPATLAARSPNHVTSVIRELDRSYVIDPRTSIFQNASRRPVPRRYAAAAELYGPAFEAVLRGRVPIERLTDDDWSRAAANVTRLQLQIAGATSRQPLGVVPPYLVVDANLAHEWRLNLAMLEEAHRSAGELPVAVVVTLRSDVPADPDLDALEAMLCAIERFQREQRRVSAVFYWLDGCREDRLPIDAVNRLAQLVRAHEELPLFNLSGGYLSLLLHQFGLAGVGSGIGDGESRYVQYLGPPRDRPPLPGYYLPMIHLLVSPTLAAAFIRAAGVRAACECFACRKVGGVDVDRLDPNYLMLHHLLAKHEERERVAKAELDSLIDDLWDGYRLAGRAAERLPDSLQAVFPYYHLEAWARGLTATSALS